MRKINLSLLSALGLASCLQAFGGTPAEAQTPAVTVTIGSIQERPTEFFGAGYHVFYPIHVRQLTPEAEAILHKRWTELNPSFARVTHMWDWNLDVAAREMEFLRSTGTRIYLTTWDPECPTDPDEIQAYAKRVADLLDELTNNRHLDHIRWYCMTNELSLPGEWGGMNKDLPRFEANHRAIYTALKEENVHVGLLATDASPATNWDTIDWAAEHMNDITAVYGGHHYTNYAPDDPTFFPWFKGAVREKAGLAHGLGKAFIIGEFGPKQFRGARFGYENWDGCAWFETPEEPLAAVQAAEAVIAAVDGGADAMGYWTFADFPDDFSAKYANKWGVVRWDETFSRRPVYFTIGLLTRFMRGPADVCDNNAPDLIRCLAIRERADGKYRIALINRNEHPVRIRLDWTKGDHSGSWSGYQFNPLMADTYVKQDSLLNDANRMDIDIPTGFVVPPQSLAVLVED